MTWLRSEATQENPENLEARLTSLKEEIADAVKQLELSTEKLNEVKAGKHELLKEKANDLNEKIKEQQALIIDLKESQGDLEFEKEQHSVSVASHLDHVNIHKAAVLGFNKSVAQRNKELDDREAEIKRWQAEAAELIKLNTDKEMELLRQGNELNAKEGLLKSKEEILAKAEIKLANEAKLNSVMLEEVNKKLDSLERIQEQLNHGQAEVMLRYKESQEALAKNLEALAKTEAVKNENVNVLIELKRSTAINNDKLNILTKKEVEVNQKLAELKELKEILSK